jgi:rod shape determining protein RodA
MFAYIQRHFDIQVGAASLLLTGIGAISIYSATVDAHAMGIFNRQMVWLLGGTVLLVIITFLPLRLMQSLSWAAYFFSLFLLVCVLLLGKTVSGSTSWFNLGAFRIQPSEFAKITTVLALASYLSRSDISLQTPRDLLTAAGIVAFPVVLILLQPDFGTTVIYAGMFFVILFWGGASRFTLLAIVAPIASAVAALFGTTFFLIVVAVLGVLIYVTMEHRLVAAVVFSLMVLFGISVQVIYDGLKPYQQKRIETFLNPNADPLGAGYNSLQSKVAIGSGGVLGKGYLRGSQTQLNFIPEQWTDFIFCVPGEEFGFVGAGTVLLLFAVLLVRGVTLASLVKSRYASFVAVGLTSILAVHVFLNIGMALGLLPVIGVPLPFLSYGGSALITNTMMIGILMNLYTNRKEY